MRYFLLLFLFFSSSAFAEQYKVIIEELDKPFKTHQYFFKESQNQIEPIMLFKGTKNESTGGILFENGSIKIGLKKAGQYLSTSREGWNHFSVSAEPIEKERVTFYLPHPSILNDNENTGVWRPANAELGSANISVNVLSE